MPRSPRFTAHMLASATAVCAKATRRFASPSGDASPLGCEKKHYATLSWIGHRASTGVEVAANYFSIGTYAATVRLAVIVVAFGFILWAAR
jgi:hypothetical protein